MTAVAVTSRGDGVPSGQECSTMYREMGGRLDGEASSHLAARSFTMKCVKDHRGPEDPGNALRLVFVGVCGDIWRWKYPIEAHTKRLKCLLQGTAG